MKGKDLDREVAEKVLGWAFERESTQGYGVSFIDHVGKRRNIGATILPGLLSWSPSSNIAHAWEVIERLRADGLTVTISTPLPDRRMWDVRGWDVMTNDRRFIAHAATAPEAICLAALSALSSSPTGRK